MRLQPPPLLVLLAAACALGLLMLGAISQRTYAPMNVPDRISYEIGSLHYGPYPIAFTMTAAPPHFTHPCRFERANGSSATCRWFMYLADQTHEDRIRLLFHEGSGATSHPLTVRYGDAATQEPAAADSESSAAAGWLWQNSRMRTLGVYAGIFAVFGLLVLWRGREAAIWLGLFCVCLAPFFLNFYGALSPDGISEAWTLGVLLRTLADFSLFAMALMLVAPYFPSRFVYAFAASGIALSVLAVLWSIVPKFEGIFRGYVDPWLELTKGHALGAIEITLLGVLPIGLLIAGIRKAREPERSRLIVVAAVIAFGLIGPVIDGSLYGADHFGELWATALLIPIGFTYAIPRYHVVDVGFVVNRIVIYVLLVGTVSATIAFAEVVITKFAVELANPAAMMQILASKTFAKEFQGSLVREAPIVFVIVLSLRWIHKKLEEFVNQVLFRKRHEALNDLKAFIRRTEFSQTREGLLRSAVHEIGKALGTRGVAVYQKGGTGYHRADHIGAFAQHVEDDDPAIWFMRAERAPARLAGMASALGESGIAFPMCLRGGLYGAIVCGPRQNEQYEGDYAPDELAVMEELAGRLAEQIFALAADGYLQFVTEVASGALAGDALMTRAAALADARADARERA